MRIGKTGKLKPDGRNVCAAARFSKRHTLLAARHFLTMNKPNHHLFVCGSFRANGERQGVCHKKDSMSILSYLQGEIQDRMLDGVEVAVTGCMNACTKGPVMVDYPTGNYYRVPNNDAIDAILDAIENNSVAEDFLLT
jgi:(2Fe-2S) ferredoxin